MEEAMGLDILATHLDILATLASMKLLCLLQWTEWGSFTKDPYAALSPGIPNISDLWQIATGFWCTHVSESRWT
ncbi:hypothetical protein GDO81_024275 [Engystomops pustulosus]|uniref:Uncharacterized protein n=1 Tax=Engystomops pustulosus TaxID=76066 RepID=A0AAV6ZTG2_ENGPU|nr:hypothetical protein GDO81_024275 [Engystomops pustulosus]